MAFREGKQGHLGLRLWRHLDFANRIWRFYLTYGDVSKTSDKATVLASVEIAIVKVRNIDIAASPINSLGL